MTITAYAFPVLYDVSFPGSERPPKTDRSGILVIEFGDDGEDGGWAFLFNRNCDLQGNTPQILNPVDYDANSWAMCFTRIPRAGLEYNDGTIRVRIKPLPLNSPIGKIIRHEYNDIPLKTIKEF